MERELRGEGALWGGSSVGRVLHGEGAWWGGSSVGRGLCREGAWWIFLAVLGLWHYAGFSLLQ